MSLCGRQWGCDRCCGGFVVDGVRPWYLLLVSIIRDAETVTRSTAKLFKHGRSQAVRLPKEFRMPGTEVRIRRVGNGILLEPIETDVDKWLAEIDRLRAIAGGEFLPEGRPEQPPMPDGSEIDFDRDPEP